MQEDQNNETLYTVNDKCVDCGCGKLNASKYRCGACHKASREQVEAYLKGHAVTKVGLSPVPCESVTGYKTGGNFIRSSLFNGRRGSGKREG